MRSKHKKRPKVPDPEIDLRTVPYQPSPAPSLRMGPAQIEQFAGLGSYTQRERAALMLDFWHGVVLVGR